MTHTTFEMNETLFIQSKEKVICWNANATMNVYAF